MGLHTPMRVGAVLAVGIVFALLPAAAGSAAPSEGERIYHPGAVKGQTIELAILAPANATKMTFKMQGLAQMVDTEPPFLFLLSTFELRPAHYKWHSTALGTGCCDSQSTGGSIQIYPLPRIRPPKISALVVTGTTKLAGLVVSRVTSNRVVRAWSFPDDPESGSQRLPLVLRHESRSKRVYRFAPGFTVPIGKRTQIDVEVAPKQRTLVHGVEQRGRLARLWLTHNPHNGVTRAHRSHVVACTTQGEREETMPKPQSCTESVRDQIVSIVCAKSVPCGPRSYGRPQLALPAVEPESHDAVGDHPHPVAAGRVDHLQLHR